MVIRKSTSPPLCGIICGCRFGPSFTDVVFISCCLCAAEAFLVRRRGAPRRSPLFLGVWSSRLFFRLVFD